jgi:ATP-dependent RNA helicase DDX5/DBP2
VNHGEVSVRGCQVTPWNHFEDCNFPPQILNSLLNAGFPHPSPIQAYAWPLLTEGRDLIGVAKTGSGKTLGFLLPAFKTMIQQRLDPYRAGGPLLLTLAPTRELACQIEVEAQKFGNPAGIRSACSYGGAPKGPQLGQLRRGAHVLIATPGRLNDFLKMGAVRLRSILYLVLDEADRMLDMGFEPQIRMIIAEIPTSRQTMMFTATWPREVRRLAEEFLRNPAHVQIGNTDALQANADIEQRVAIVGSQWEKQDKLVELLSGQVQAGDRVLVFTSTKRMCDQLARTLEGRNRIPCVSIHGDREQRERDAALAAFKNGRSPVMVATDVAARGLDIKGVKMVINFDAANNAEDYVHRIGRTGRAGEKGLAVTLLTPDETKQAREIADVMIKTGKRVPDELADMARNARRSGGNSRYGGGKGYGKGGYGKGNRGGYGGNRHGGNSNYFAFRAN